jgi:hypothetical protein
MSMTASEVKKTWTFYWRDGNHSRLVGRSALAAFQNAGYGNGAIPAVDFYIPTSTCWYWWNRAEHSWVKCSRREYSARQIANNPHVWQRLPRLAKLAAQYTEVSP